MPSTLFHLKVGYEFATKHTEYNKPEFYLGVIAPDAVNLNGFAEKSIRWKSHNRDWNLDIWKNNIINLYNNLKDKNDNVYLLGYIVHILTDIVVDDLYLNKGIYNDILSNGIKPDDAFDFFNVEVQKYAKSQLNEKWWSNTVNMLNNACAEDINGIGANMITAWKDKELSYYSNMDKDNYDYIKPDFLLLVTNYVIDILKENGIIL